MGEIGHHEHRIGSELNVGRCFRVSDEELACELAARLALTAREKLQLFSMKIPKAGGVAAKNR